VSCLTANSVSKAILRVAVDELLRAHPDDERLFYWPSYEIVKEYAEDPYLDDNRHPRAEIIDLIMRTFATHYLVDPRSSQEMDGGQPTRAHGSSASASCRATSASS
jgi:hypothetical protein